MDRHPDGPLKSNEPPSGAPFICAPSVFPSHKPHILISSVVPITIDNNFNTTVEIKFGSGTPFENDPVIPTLTQFSQLASETVDWFGPLIAQTKNIT